MGPGVLSPPSVGSALANLGACNRAKLGLVENEDVHEVEQAAVERRGRRQIEDGRGAILDGVKPGDRVIVEGFQKFESGDRVNPKPWRDEGRAGEELPRAAGADASASTR